MNRRERRAAGRAENASISASLDVALAHLQAGRHLDAQLGCSQVLATSPDHADALHLMGQLSLHGKQYDHAVEWFARAIRQEPKPEYLASLGTALQQQGRHDDAFKSLETAIQLSPSDPELWRQLGDILVQLERFDQALLAFQHVLKLDPQHQDALYKSGTLLNQFGRYEEAIGYLDHGAELLPDHAPTLQARARALCHLKRMEEALAEALRAYQLDPLHADNCNNIGLALRWLGRDEEALPWFDKAFEAQSSYAAALDNKIVSLHRLHRFEEVFALEARMRALKLHSATTEWNVSLVHLSTGDFEAGWRGHQARLKLDGATYPDIPRPMWLGDQDIQGKTILVAADEGLGDAIQYARYIPTLAERGARVLLIVQDPLHRLLSGLRGVAQCVPISAVGGLPAFELHCPLSSLPFAFKTRLDTIPSATSYLPPPAVGHLQAWQDRLGGHGKLRVGLVWSGNPKHVNDHNRSIPLQMLLSMLDIDATFVSLQKDPRPDDAAILRDRSDVIDLTADLTDFTATAALVCCLDLVITVDTSVAHLAGTLGRPTWILLPYTPDYRWLLDRDDSPWYPTARLFRQSQTRTWEPVVQQVKQALQQFVGNAKG